MRYRAIKLPFVFSSWYHFEISEIVALCNTTGKIVVRYIVFNHIRLLMGWLFHISPHKQNQKRKKKMEKNNTQNAQHTRSHVDRQLMTSNVYYVKIQLRTGIE